MATYANGNTINTSFDIDSKLTFKVRGHEVLMDLATAKDADQIIKRLALYGLRKFNDASPMGATAPNNGTDEQKAAFALECASNAREMVKDWLAGEFETERSGGGRTANPVAVEARAIAIAYFTTKFGRKPEPKNDDDKATLAKIIAHPTIVAKAEKAVAERAVEIDIDL